MRSGFFNSEIIGYDAENMPVFDRAEEASFFAKYFSEFISNGVFPNPSTNMQVLETEGMNVKVEIGVCYINGYMGWVEPAEILEIEESDVQSRIDRIVARLDFTDRSIKLYVKKGTPLGNPVAPELQRDYDIYEIGLADIRINANVIEITQENITDLRLNTEICGVVANQLQHVDTTTLFNQYQDWLRRVIGESETYLKHKKEDFETYLENLKAVFTSDFNKWFQTIKEVLDENTAGNLYNLIITNTELINTKSNKKKVYNIEIDTENWTEGTKTIEVEGIQETDEVNIYPIWSESKVSRQQEKEEYDKISMIKSGENTIEIICDDEFPIIPLKARIEVVY